jgi:hypothetical protein
MITPAVMVRLAHCSRLRLAANGITSAVWGGTVSKSIRFFHSSIEVSLVFSPHSIWTVHWASRTGHRCSSN